jgi:antitoxin HigA-1
MEMFNPPHPGEIVREDCLIPLGLSVADGAKRLGVSRQSLSELLNGHNGISAAMALRLEKAGWSTAETWLRNQTSYDLWQARNPDESARAFEAQRKIKAAAKKRTAKKAAVKRAPPAKKRAF